MIRYFFRNLVLGNIPLFFFLRVFWYVSNALSILFTWLLKMEDLSRMYRLYCKIPKGLDPVSTIFKQVSCLLLTFIFISTRNLADVHFITYWYWYFWWFPCCSMLLLKVPPWCNRLRMLQVVRLSILIYSP